MCLSILAAETEADVCRAFQDSGTIQTLSIHYGQEHVMFLSLDDQTVIWLNF